MKKKQSIVIRSCGGLSAVEIDGMVREAEANVQADEWRKSIAEVRNTSFTVKQQGAELTSNLPPSSSPRMIVTEP